MQNRLVLQVERRYNRKRESVFQLNKVVEAVNKATVYYIMHAERCVAQVSTAGECKICFADFMPYDLVLRESNDFDARINNVIGFHSWCASRLIPNDRTYAKEILNSIGASQSTTDGERARIALSYTAYLCWMCSG